jgi:hypothetical protein
MMSSPHAKINNSLATRRAVSAAINTMKKKDTIRRTMFIGGTVLMNPGNPRIGGGFKYGTQEDDIYGMQSIIKTVQY